MRKCQYLGHVVRAARLDKTKEKWKERIDEMHELGGGRPGRVH